MNWYRKHEGHAQEPDPYDEPIPPELPSMEEPPEDEESKGKKLIIIAVVILAILALIVVAMLWITQNVVFTFDPKEYATLQAKSNPNAPSSVQTLPPDICLVGGKPAFIQFSSAYSLRGPGVGIAYLSKSGQFIFIATDSNGSITTNERWPGYPCPQ